MDSKNINANIAQRLFAYIQYHDDINENIKNIYKNSLIFIGDEQQIYVPAMETYVGIGMTAYNTTLDTISEIQSAVAQLQKKASGASVNYITTGFTFGSEVRTSDDNGDLKYGTYIDANTSALNPVNLGDSNASNFMSGKVFIFGEDNYNPDTHFAYHPGSRFILQNNEGDVVRVSGTDALDNSWKENATSGISLSYGTFWTYVHVDGNDIYAPSYSYLRINDSKTWSYMTSAYSYTLDFTRNYTDLQVETLYHDLLGIGEQILVPVANSSMWKVDPTTGNSNIFIGGTFYEWDASTTPVIPISLNNSDNPSDWTMPTGETNNWKTFSGNFADFNNDHEYYKISTDYNNTYNMNISNGIQTIKEVAYILDQITDGGIGTTTYLTKGQWDAATGSSNAPSYDVTSYQYDPNNTNKTYTGTIYRVISSNGNPTTNINKYAYWVNAADPENLGIQIAQSIAGNAADITDLHNHVELAEAGETSLRSISVQSAKGATSDLITVYGWNNGVAFATTDTQESLTTVTSGLSAYNVGDYRMMTKLNLSETFITLNSTGDTTERNINGIKYSGEWQPFDVIEKKADGSLGLINVQEVLDSGILLAEYKNNSYVSIVDQGGLGMQSIDDALATNRIILYKSIGTNSYQYINNTFKSITWAQYNEYATKPTVYKFELQGTSPNQYRQYSVVDSNPITSADFPAYIMNEPSETDVKVHAIISEENQVATTAWTIALVDDKQASLQDKIDGILEESKQYTDKQIRLLDADYKTQDYISTAEANIASTYVPGTEAYEEEIMRLRNAYANTARNYSDDANTTFDDNVLINRVRSEYTYNVYEVNGIVSAEGRELPTDLVSANTKVWNAENIAFTEVDLTTGDNNGEPSTASDKLQHLFAAVYNENTLQADPIYFKPGDANHTTYLPVDSTGTFGTATSYSYFNSETGKYEAFTGAGDDDKWAAVSNKRFNSPYWTQPYTNEYQYYEVDIDTINSASIAASFGQTINGNIDVELLFFTYNNGREYYNGSTTPTLYRQSGDVAKSTDYILAKSEHYDYTKFGGNGQNKISIEAHITRIEDAAFDNTGFADAYDVQTYIENMFTWVNISASIESTQLNGSEKFYKKYTEFDNSATNLYIYDSNTNKFVSFDGSEKLWFGTSKSTGETVAALVSGSTVAASATNPGASADNVITSTLHQWWGDGSHNKQVNVYARTQQAYINPINMTLTKVAPVDNG